jgi:hypothetical protein
VNETMKDGTARATARRRLIRGAFGAPAALTLYSGNVFAQSSSTRALRNQFLEVQYPGPVDKTLVDSPTDTWIRVPVYRSRIVAATTTVAAKYVSVVSGADVARQPGCGIALDFTGPWLTLNGSTPFQPADNPSQAPTGEWAALRFNADGLIIGVIRELGDSNGGGSALTRSAGASLTDACLTPTKKVFGADGFWR